MQKISKKIYKNVKLKFFYVQKIRNKNHTPIEKLLYGSNFEKISAVLEIIGIVAVYSGIGWIIYKIVNFFMQFR
ncbi:MAG: hypothetical protein Fur0024_5190 [Patescibacteria group bacterium]